MSDKLKAENATTKAHRVFMSVISKADPETGRVNESLKDIGSTIGVDRFQTVHRYIGWAIADGLLRSQSVRGQVSTYQVTEKGARFAIALSKQLERDSSRLVNAQTILANLEKCQGEKGV